MISSYCPHIICPINYFFVEALFVSLQIINLRYPTPLYHRYFWWFFKSSTFSLPLISFFCKTVKNHICLHICRSLIYFKKSYKIINYHFFFILMLINFQLSRSFLYNGRNNMQAWGLIVLLISKAAGHIDVDVMEEDKAAGVLHRYTFLNPTSNFQYLNEAY